ncbi:hypothetical protein HPB47_012751 [Ixodes persulcatus]|uniref:Uncharacterized protein n=1 Tax=Ixodes persulcatus TaxID=34615 RepID=A0AC60NSP4_IXOPE|nr:hypothetical protein HPB47_012751 [Ixodes persulcatus]
MPSKAQVRTSPSWTASRGGQEAASASPASCSLLKAAGSLRVLCRHGEGFSGGVFRNNAAREPMGTFLFNCPRINSTPYSVASKIMTKKLKMSSIESKNINVQLQLDVDALEWRSRRLNIEIHGIPDTDGEDLFSKVNDLAVRLEVGTLAGEDISAFHRLPARPGRTRGIIVRFARQELRDTWLAKRGVLRNSEDRVFICENMTSRSRGLLSAAKEWLKQSGYKYAWHANGKILVPRATGDSATIIKCEDDLRVLR